MNNCSVYLHLGDGDEVLYVGCTLDLPRRTRDHRRLAPWFGQVVRVVEAAFLPTPAAMRLEEDLIRFYRPQFNILCNPDRPEWVPAA